MLEQFPLRRRVEPVRAPRLALLCEVSQGTEVAIGQTVQESEQKMRVSMDISSLNERGIERADERHLPFVVAPGRRAKSPLQQARGSESGSNGHLAAAALFLYSLLNPAKRDGKRASYPVRFLGGQEAPLDCPTCGAHQATDNGRCRSPDYRAPPVLGMPLPHHQQQQGCPPRSEQALAQPRPRTCLAGSSLETSEQDKCGRRFQ